MPAEIRSMTMADFERLNRHWAQHPAHGDLLHILARLWGWKPKHIESEPIEDGAFQAALAATGDMFKAPRRWFKG